MRHLKRVIFIMLLMASLMTISACGSGNQAYPNPDEYPYPYTNP
jgi:predicted small lipoprotein YifL